MRRVIFTLYLMKENHKFCVERVNEHNGDHYDKLNCDHKSPIYYYRKNIA